MVFWPPARHQPDNTSKFFDGTLHSSVERTDADIAWCQTTALIATYARKQRLLSDWLFVCQTFRSASVKSSALSTARVFDGGVSWSFGACQCSSNCFLRLSSQYSIGGRMPK